MPHFTYQALTADEELRTGELFATSAAAALAELEAQGLAVLLIRKIEAPSIERSSLSPMPVPFAATAGEQIFRQRVGELLEHRNVLAPALTAFAEEMPRGRARKELEKLTTQMQSSATAAEMTQSPQQIRAWLPLLASGPTIGTKRLQEIFAEADRDLANRAQLTRSLAYPTTVFLISVAVLAFLSIAVVPTFKNIFDDFGLDLPWITQVMLFFSSLLLYQPFQFLTLAAVVTFILYVVVRVVRNWIFPSRMLGLFFDGNSQQVGEMARYVRQLTEALKAEIPLPDALQLVGKTSPHRWLQQESQELASVLVADSNDVTRLRRSSLPATVVYALQAGPEGAPHIPLLQTLADGYAERVRNRLRLSTGFLPQLAIISIGLVVAIVVFALFIPLVMLVNGLTG
jgi:type IV pilus assembly protein PilC